MNEHTNQPKLDALADRLDELAERERSIPDDGFEGRVLETVRARALAPLGRPIRVYPAAWRSSWTLAAAASVAIVVTAAMFLWVGAPTPQRPPNPGIASSGETSTEVDEFIETVAWLEASLPDFSTGSASVATPSLDSIDDLYEDVQQTLSIEVEFN